MKVAGLDWTELDGLQISPLPGFLCCKFNKVPSWMPPAIESVTFKMTHFAAHFAGSNSMCNQVDFDPY
jgi:hypothetical protein